MIARDLINQVDFGAGLQLGAIDLMARDGMASGGVWKRVERFELGGWCFLAASATPECRVQAFGVCFHDCEVVLAR